MPTNLLPIAGILVKPTRNLTLHLTLSGGRLHGTHKPGAHEPRRGEDQGIAEVGIATCLPQLHPQTAREE